MSEKNKIKFKVGDTVQFIDGSDIPQANREALGMKKGVTSNCYKDLSFEVGAVERRLVAIKVSDLSNQPYGELQFISYPFTRYGFYGFWVSQESLKLAIPKEVIVNGRKYILKKEDS